MSFALRVEESGLPTDYSSLVQAYLLGDVEAGEELAASVRSVLLRRLRRYSANGMVAEELAQECMLQIFSRLSEFDPVKGYFESWVSGFAMNALRSNWRREVRSRVVSVPVEDIEEASYEINQFEDERELLASALHSLDLLDQELLHMRYSLGMSSDEIAASSDLNAPQVRKRISRAVERLRKHPAVIQIVR